LFINVGNVVFHNFFWCKLVFVRFEHLFFVCEPISSLLTKGEISRTKAQVNFFFMVSLVDATDPRPLPRRRIARGGFLVVPQLPRTTRNLLSVSSAKSVVIIFRPKSVHIQVIGDVQVTTFDGAVDGVLACRQRRQQQIHAIFGGSSHRDAIRDAGESEEIGDDVIR